MRVLVRRRVVLQGQPLLDPHVLELVFAPPAPLHHRDSLFSAERLSELWAEGEELACEAHLSGEILRPRVRVEIFW